MQALRTISVTVALATMGVSIIGLNQAGARGLYDTESPAEFPPRSYTGAQYVDSRGCVFVRAGTEALVNWVPRVSRDRRVLCGFKPTFASVEEVLPVIPDPVTAPSETVEAETPAPAPTPFQGLFTRQTTIAAVEAPKPTPAPQPVAAKPAPLPTTPKLDPLTALAGQTVGERGCVANEVNGRMICSTGDVDYILKRLPAGVTVRTADGGRMTTTEPTLVRVPVKSAPAAPAPVMMAAVPAPAPVQPQTTTLAATAAAQCAGLTGSSAQYMTSGRYKIRCGPQAVHPSDYIQQRMAAGVSTRNATQTEVARNAGIPIYALPAPTGAQAPKGYKQAWTDGRLNPNRGPLTARGDLQMAQLWSGTTPRYDHYQPRKKTFWEWLFGTNVHKKRTVTVASAPMPSDPGAIQLSTRSVAPAQTPSVSSAATRQVQPAPAGLRYVQVGTFGVPANAERSIARLSAMGYPVSSQTTTRGGKTLKIVLAGPFARPEQTMSALGAVRGAGYGDAFARK